MLSRSAKAAFFGLARPLMVVNGWLRRSFRHPMPGPNGLRLHLGPGRKRYLDGWVNIDANMFTGKCDVWADLRDPLPVNDACVEAVYSHHMVEHLPDLQSHFDDVFRVLRPGGVYRVGGPNGDMAVRKFIEGDHAWFSDFPDSYSSIGGRFVNLIFCRNEHLTMLTASFLSEIAINAGFGPGRPLVPTKETDYPAMFAECLEIEYEAFLDSPRTLLMEFRKPRLPLNKTA